MLPVELANKYELRGTLGAGAMGTVLDAVDRIIERRVAIKVVKVPSANDPEGVEAHARFRREAQAAGRLSHANIVGVYDYGENAETAWIVMELVEGGSLKDRLDKQERFTVAEVGRLMGQVCSALAYSHARGVVHRDIKPGNIMLSSRGADAQVKIADFGIARLENSSMTQVGTLIGTPSYMAPEQFRGEPVDARADIWAAGVMLYQLLTGEKPFEGGFSAVMHKALHTEPPPPSQLSGIVPRSFDGVIAKALAKRPDDRYASAEAFAQGIQEAIANPNASGAGAGAMLPMAGMDSDATVLATGIRPGGAGDGLPGLPGLGGGPPPAPAAIKAGPTSTPKPAEEGKKSSSLGLVLGGGGVAVAAAAAAVWFLVLAPPAGPTPEELAQQAAMARLQAEEASARAEAERRAEALRQAEAARQAEAQRLADIAAQEAAQREAAARAEQERIAEQQRQEAARQAELQRLALQQRLSQEDQARRQALLREQEAARQAEADRLAEIARREAAERAAQAEAARQLEAARQAEIARQEAAERARREEAQRQVELARQAELERQRAVAAAIRAAGPAVIAATTCALLSSTASDQSITISGVMRRGEEGILRQDLLARGVPDGAARLAVQTFDGPYCRALDVFRPVLAQGDQGPRVSLVGQSPLVKGQLMRLAVQMPDRPSHLYVAYFMYSGEVANLVPSQFQQAGARLTLGEPRGNFPGWEVDEPFGTDLAVVIASDRPLFGASRPQVERQEDYLNALTIALRNAQQAGNRVQVRPIIIETVASR